MTFAVDRTDIDSRFRDVRALISLIKRMESEDVPPVDSDEVKILRGLFYVHLYGAFEKSINDIVQAYLRKVESLNIVKAHTSPHFWPTALDASFKSLQSTLGSGNWKKRGEFIFATESNEVCAIADGVFSEQLQNIWPETIDTVFLYLGLGQMDWIDLDILAVREVVDKRNQVAHGRTAPVRVGNSVRSPGLELRLNSLYLIVSSIADQMEGHIEGLRFIRAEHREGYRG